MFRNLIHYILKATILAKRLQILETKKRLYLNMTDKQEIYDYQLEKFNQTWKYCLENIPFYRERQKKYNLPDRISSIEEIRKFPELTKKDIYENQDFILKNLENYYL